MTTRTNLILSAETWLEGLTDALTLKHVVEPEHTARFCLAMIVHRERNGRLNLREGTKAERELDALAALQAENPVEVAAELAAEG